MNERIRPITHLDDLANCPPRKLRQAAKALRRSPVSRYLTGPHSNSAEILRRTADLLDSIATGLEQPNVAPKDADMWLVLVSPPKNGRKDG